ncbi:hypothetical protein [Congzhengia minquanensis]|uniref:Uncharacterized protein n=1 Tax=Congzhengia minquanensis TaxID=2763657 RepID=A0A926HY38_9FIRM|nr:hypothetical protein [Congzhengia minquanensis]MBC8539735.1 hypothetical protein [Congzhengia minquanensis]
MKINAQTIVWFDKPVKEQKLTATLGSNKKLLLNDALQSKLPENIQFGFDMSSRTLLIVGTQDSKYKKRKMNTVFGLAPAIADLGMKLPVSFDFTYDKQNNWWVGQIILRKKNSEYDTEQILALYKPLADKIFKKMAKTTPPEDRRQNIGLAFCEAAKQYTPDRGNFEEYLTKHTEYLVKMANHAHVKYVQMESKSIDAAFHNDKSQNFNLYSVIKYNDLNYVKIENKMLDEQFERQLTKSELSVYKMLLNEYTIEEISENLNILPEKIESLAKSVGIKRKKFYLS